MSTLQGESFYFHHGWHFLRADAFPMAKAVDAHRDAEGHAFYEADYRETGWQPVTLPHTFNDEDLFRDRIQDGGSGQRRTAAFYRNILTIPARHKNHKVLLAFEGLRQTCYLYVNGTLAGYYEAGVAPFGFDITPYVRYDAPNLIAIATDNTATRNAPFCIAETPNKPDAVPGSYLFPQEQAVPADRVGVPFFWNCNDFNPSVGGITRPVQVFFKPAVYLTLPLYSNLQTKGLYVYGRNFDLDNATADIRVEAEIRNEGKVPVSAQLRITLRRPDGSVAAIFDGAPATAAPTGRAVPPLSITPADAYIPDEAVPGHYRPVEDESLPAPTATDSMAVTVLHAGADTLPLRFWSIDDPYLYTVEAELFVNGEKTDAQQLTTGFRAVSYDKDRGLRINGAVQWLRGYAQRAANEWAAIGIAPEWLHDEDAALIRESNANHIRFMHVAGSPADVRAFDRRGIVCTQPAGDKEKESFGRQWDQRVELMRDRLPQPPVHSVLGGRQQLDLTRAHAGDAAAQAAAGPPRRAFYGLPHPEHRGGRQRERVCRHDAEPPRRPLFVAARPRHRDRVQPRGGPPPHLGRLHPAGFRLPQPLGRQGRQKSHGVRLLRPYQ